MSRGYGSVVVVGFLALVACSGEVASQGTGGAGGAIDGSGHSGGLTGSGGTFSGGAPPSGGGVSSGGTITGGGSSGGAAGSGGAVASGGAAGSDGAIASGGADAGSDGATGGCANPLDASMLERLTIGPAPTIELRPGDHTQLEVGTYECCNVFQPRTNCVKWSVGASAPITVDAHGVLAVNATASPGSFYVSADVEGGRLVLTREVSVYTPEAQPLVGTWHETAQLECGTFAKVDVANPIQELLFRADGRVFVTWTPFESYVDYGGQYTSSEDGRLSFSVGVLGNVYVPTDADFDGNYTIEDGRLVLRDMWLGSPRQLTAPTRCGHVFER